MTCGITYTALRLLRRCLRLFLTSEKKACVFSRGGRGDADGCCGNCSACRACVSPAACIVSRMGARRVPPVHHTSVAFPDTRFVLPGDRLVIHDVVVRQPVPAFQERRAALPCDGQDCGWQLFVLALSWLSLS